MESNYTGEYHRLFKTGIFTKNDIKGDLMTHNHYIPASRINQYFFGTNSFFKDFSIINLYSNKIIKKEMNIYWVDISKVEKYLDYVIHKIEPNNNFNCCPYNYYKTYGKDNVIPEHYKRMINSIDKFLNYLDNKDTIHAKTIRYILTPNAKNKELSKLEVESSDVLELGNLQNHIILSFKKKGKPLFIEMRNSVGIPNSDNSYLPIYEDVTDDILNNLYKNLTNKLLMDNPEDFLINNVEKICGSREFAEIMVKSYLYKKDFIFRINDISSLIQWKNNNTQQTYYKYFTSRYEHCIKTIEEELFINFEGINKFFLNITESDVGDFEVKEQINDMYYNSMQELIYSFELLYKNKS